jgi:hypothetical protein
MTSFTYITQGFVFIHCVYFGGPGMPDALMERSTVSSG